MNTPVIHAGHNTISILTPHDTSPIEKQVFDGKLLRTMPAAFYGQFPRDMVSRFLLDHGLYVLPTLELVSFLREEIDGREDKTIEIGCGHGAVGRALGIKLTDSKLAIKNKMVAQYYAAHKQAVAYFPPDVLTCDAADAIKRFKPEIVIGCYITHRNKAGKNEPGNYWGVNEVALVKKVQKYIMVGNLHTHRNKPNLVSASRVIELNGLITRGAHQKLNRVFIWEH